MNFDSVARSYGWLERLAFGNALQRCRIAYLNPRIDAKDVLILGEGRGRFLKAYLDQHPHANITVVDSSEAMLQLAQAGIADAQRVNWIHADARQVDLGDQSFDLIVTQFFLDCFEREDIQTIIVSHAGRLVENGHWIYADFAVPKSGGMRFLSKAIIWALYRFFGLTARLDARRLIDPTAIFEGAGFALVDRRSSLRGMLQAVRWKKNGVILKDPLEEA